MMDHSAGCVSGLSEQAVRTGAWVACNQWLNNTKYISVRVTVVGLLAQYHFQHSGLHAGVQLVLMTVDSFSDLLRSGHIEAQASPSIEDYDITL